MIHELARQESPFENKPAIKDFASYPNAPRAKGRKPKEHQEEDPNNFKRKSKFHCYTLFPHLCSSTALISTLDKSNGLFRRPLLYLWEESCVFAVQFDPFLDPLVLKMRGATLTSISRRVGRQVQIIPTLTSMVDHQPMIQLSQVGLVELEK